MTAAETWAGGLVLTFLQRLVEGLRWFEEDRGAVGVAAIRHADQARRRCCEAIGWHEGFRDGVRAARAAALSGAHFEAASVIRALCPEPWADDPPAPTFALEPSPGGTR